MTRGIVLAWLAALLSGCGAETATVAAIGYIAPIGGDFTHDTDPMTPQLEAADPPETINIQIGDGWDQFYDTKFEVTGTADITGLPAGCEQFVGLVDERGISAFKTGTSTRCFDGEFLNESTLKLTDGRLLLRDFPVVLDAGTWVNIRDDRQQFVFDRVVGTSFSGCEIVNGHVTPVIGEFVASDIANGVLASVKSLVVQRAGGPESYSGTFEGASGIRLNGSGGEILLQRRNVVTKCQ